MLIAPAWRTAAAEQPPSQEPPEEPQDMLSQEFCDMIAAVMHNQHQELEKQRIRQLENQNRNMRDLYDRMDDLGEERLHRLTSLMPSIQESL